MPTVTSLLE